METLKPTALPSWKQLLDHHQSICNTRLTDFFSQEPDRITALTFEFRDLHFDLSKNRADNKAIQLLLELADETQLGKAIQNLFNGSSINKSEQHAALHTALRSPRGKPVTLDGTDISGVVHKELDRMDKFVNMLHKGRIKGFSGKPIDNLVNIGIGGSELGPKMAVHALKPFRISALNIQFVSNIDPGDINEVLNKSNPETTLFIISSKSFHTQETITNANTAKTWLTKNKCKHPHQQFVAVTSNHDAAIEYGIDTDSVFHFWDWTGGRYSIWSSIGLPVAAAIGMENFRQLLAGAYEMDEHFRTAPLTENIPVLLALFDIWYINFFKCESIAVFPYDTSLRYLPEYLGQLIMESNGKSVTQNNENIDYPTAPVIWGGIGTNVQHAYFQMLHQGTRFIPVEFLLPLDIHYQNKDHHQRLIANGIAQAEALMTGNHNVDKHIDLQHEFVTGNKPSSVILYKKLLPETLGRLIAMYEHRTFTQGHIWGVNSFDQWGVEFGKTLAESILKELQDGVKTNSHDPSTNELITRFINKKTD